MFRITENIITDLLPLYYSKHASEDTIKLVDHYFSQNPIFASEHQFPISLSTPKLEQPDELKILKTTRYYIKIKSLLMFVAIFTTFLPFSVSWIEKEGVHWLWKDTPEVAILSGAAAIIFWVLYAILRRNLRIIEL